MQKFKIYFKTILIPVLIGGIVGILISGSMDYNYLEKPFLSPPSILFPNAMWSIIFFILKWRFFAFLWILLLDILVIIMINKFYNKDKLAGLLQIPYLIWILFATYLNLAFYLLNG